MSAEAIQTRREWLLSDRPASRMQARLGRAYVAWRRFSANRLAFLGLLIIIALLVVAAFADVLAPYSPTIGDLKNARLLAPSARYCPARGPAPQARYLRVKSGDFSSFGCVATTIRTM